MLFDAFVYLADKFDTDVVPARPLRQAACLPEPVFQEALAMWESLGMLRWKAGLLRLSAECRGAIHGRRQRDLDRKRDQHSTTTSASGMTSATN